MILKDNQYATVIKDGNLVIKKFKLGQEFLIDDYEKWQRTCNHFSEIYGHFPKIIKVSAKKIIMEKVNGISFSDFQLLSYNSSLEKQIEDFKQIQLLYYKFIFNLLEFNFKNKCCLYHTDLNFTNMFINNDKLVCIDLDSVDLNSRFVPNSFINLEFQQAAENLEDQRNKQLRKMAGAYVK
jgi:predicted unusual protein kinase regulating ubiquinone biosynthesis (AarF/ABC1/UbiB family)